VLRSRPLERVDDTGTLLVPLPEADDPAAAEPGGR
jgi:hypothetical protein